MNTPNNLYLMHNFTNLHWALHESSLKLIQGTENFTWKGAQIFIQNIRWIEYLKIEIYITGIQKFVEIQ